MAKSIFVLWSGGLDSTYLILRLLNGGFNVSSGYCQIVNNKDKTQAELRAISGMTEKLVRLFPKSFVYHGTIISSENLSSHRRGISFRQVPYFIQALILSPVSDYRALGYVAGDSAIKRLEEIRNIYNAYETIHYGVFPKLIFPLKNITKRQILAYMEKYYANILDQCVHCEHPVPETLDACGKCTPCSRLLSVASEKIVPEKLDFGLEEVKASQLTN